jgi:hypothetical protein
MDPADAAPGKTKRRVPTSGEKSGYYCAREFPLFFKFLTIFLLALATSAALMHFSCFCGEQCAIDIVVVWNG